MSTPENAGVPAGLELQRRAVTEAKLADTGYDLSMLTDTQFEDGLKRLTLVQDRIKKIIGTALVEGVHYGNPEAKGRKAFKRKILYKSGAQELRRIMRLTLRTVHRTITETPEYVSAIVEVQALDSMGRVVAQATGACNSRESRFRKHGAADLWTYIDPREALHDVIAMSEKRAGTAVSLEASGATGFFADADALEDIENAEYEVRAEWSDEQRGDFVRVAMKGHKMTKQQMLEWLGNYLGDGRTLAYADEVDALMEAIVRWKPAPTPEVVVVDQRAANSDPKTFEEPPTALQEEEELWPN